mgnify:FL=1
MVLQILVVGLNKKLNQSVAELTACSYPCYQRGMQQLATCRGEAGRRKDSVVILRSSLRRFGPACTDRIILQSSICFLCNYERWDAGVARGSNEPDSKERAVSGRVKRRV